MKTTPVVHLPLIGILLLLSLVVSAQESVDNGGYVRVWSDEFEIDGPPNPENWTFEHGFKRNRELQWYQPQNAFCEGGRLIIEARRERRPNPNYNPTTKAWQDQREWVEYTSACLKTRGLHSWQYGRFEVKARIEAEPGLWPAIWFLGVEGEWPSNGEIDLMEYYDGSILANACWGTNRRFKAKWDAEKIPLEHFGGPDWDERFHIWRMDWSPEAIELYLDGERLNTIDLSKTINPTDRGPENPFHQPHYLLLNLAIGGTQGGDPASTEFPRATRLSTSGFIKKRAHLRQTIDHIHRLSESGLKDRLLTRITNGRGWTKQPSKSAHRNERALAMTQSRSSM